MKRLYRLLFALPLLMLASCGDDDLPNVDFQLHYEGATNVDGTLYVVQGTALDFTAIDVTAANPSHNAAIASASYYWDFIPAGTTIVEPFARGFDTALYAIGPHQVQIVMSVLEEDCTPATATLAVPVMIVASADDIPAGGDTSGQMSPGSSISE